MKSIYIKFIFCSVLFSALSLHSCTLEEYNPGAFTKEALATSIDGYETLINQCYFAMERFYYGSADWMSLTEGDTDLWTYKANESTSYTQWFWFFAGTSPNTTYTNNWWNAPGVRSRSATAYPPGSADLCSIPGNGLKPGVRYWPFVRLSFPQRPPSPRTPVRLRTSPDRQPAVRSIAWPTASLHVNR